MEQRICVIELEDPAIYAFSLAVLVGIDGCLLSSNARNGIRGALDA